MDGPGQTGCPGCLKTVAADTFPFLNRSRRMCVVLLPRSIFKGFPSATNLVQEACCPLPGMHHQGISWCNLSADRILHIIDSWNV